MTLEQIGERVGGKSVSGVSNTLRLLKLPQAVKEAVFKGELTEGQVRPMIGLADEMKTASSEDPMEDTMEYAVTNLETNQPLDPMSNGEEDDENIWNEDPSDFVN